MRLEHYDPGDRHPRASRRLDHVGDGNIGGRFLARERGAFVMPIISEQDVPYLVLNAFVMQHVPAGRGRSKATSVLYSREDRELVDTDFENVCNDILRG